MADFIINFIDKTASADQGKGPWRNVFNERYVYPLVVSTGWMRKSPFGTRSTSVARGMGARPGSTDKKISE